MCNLTLIQKAEKKSYNPDYKQANTEENHFFGRGKYTFLNGQAL